MTRFDALRLFAAYAEATHMTTNEMHFILKYFGTDFEAMGNWIVKAIFAKQDTLPRDLVILAEDLTFVPCN